MKSFMALLTLANRDFVRVVLGQTSTQTKPNKQNKQTTLRGKLEKKERDQKFVHSRYQKLPPGVRPRAGSKWRGRLAGGHTGTDQWSLFGAQRACSRPGKKVEPWLTTCLHPNNGLGVQRTPGFPSVLPDTPGALQQPSVFVLFLILF